MTLMGFPERASHNGLRLMSRRRRRRKQLSAEERAWREARRRARARLSVIRHAFIYVAVCGVLFLVGRRAATSVALSWGIGLAWHYFAAIVAPGLRGRLIEREVARQVASDAPDARRTLADDTRARSRSSRLDRARDPQPDHRGEEPGAADGRGPGVARATSSYAKVALDELDRVERCISHLLRFAREEELELARRAPRRPGRLGARRPARPHQPRRRRGCARDRERRRAGADAEKLRRVLINLATNALDALAEARARSRARGAGRREPGRHRVLGARARQRSGHRRRAPRPNSSAPSTPRRRRAPASASRSRRSSSTRTAARSRCTRCPARDGVPDDAAPQLGDAADPHERAHAQAVRWRAAARTSSRCASLWSRAGRAIVAFSGRRSQAARDAGREPEIRSLVERDRAPARETLTRAATRRGHARSRRALARSRRIRNPITAAHRAWCSRSGKTPGRRERRARAPGARRARRASSELALLRHALARERATRSSREPAPARRRGRARDPARALRPAAPRGLRGRAWPTAAPTRSRSSRPGAFDLVLTDLALGEAPIGHGRAARR